jgi:hypothetical protein
MWVTEFLRKMEKDKLLTLGGLALLLFVIYKASKSKPNCDRIKPPKTAMGKTPSERTTEAMTYLEAYSLAKDNGESAKFLKDFIDDMKVSSQMYIKEVDGKPYVYDSKDNQLLMCYK